MQRLSLAIALVLAAGPAAAAGKVPYGSRAGMEVTIREVSGLGSAHARIVVEHTRADAKAFCTDYANDTSEQCVRDTLHDVHVSDGLVGNCQSGLFVTLNGDRLRFAGRNRRSGDGQAKYLLVDSKGAALTPDMASGYYTFMEQFKALCPGKIIGDD